jgi:ribosomal protein L22
VKKCLQSAIANAENNHNLDVDSLSSPKPGSARTW